MAPPTPPADVAAEGGDQHLRVSWSPGNTSENVVYYDVHALAAGDVFDPNTHADRVNQQTNSDVNKTDNGVALQDNVAYQVSIVATDAYGNVSGPSQPVTGTPVAVLDFYNLYRGEGGGATGGGGCASAGAGALGLGTGLLARRGKAPLQ